MKTHKFILAVVGLILLYLPPSNAYAETEDPSSERLVKSITSVAVAKSKLRDALTDSDSCGVGSCFNYTTSSICEIVAALDVKVSGVIIGEMTGGKPDFAISANDLRYMKKIFTQCKPTTHHSLIALTYQKAMS